jgi:hypothetical protein
MARSNGQESKRTWWRAAYARVIGVDAPYAGGATGWRSPCWPVMCSNAVTDYFLCFRGWTSLTLTTKNQARPSEGDFKSKNVQLFPNFSSGMNPCYRN